MFQRPDLRRTLDLAGLVLLLGTAPLSAQEPPLPPYLDALNTLGSTAEDRLRIGQLTGRDSVDGFLVRSASVLTPWPAQEGNGVQWSLLLPEVQAVRNSALPFSFNDGALWAGRGLNLRATAGARARYGPVSLVVAPEYVYAENQPFQTIVYPLDREPERSPFASPWHFPPYSIDLPLRHGDRVLERIGPGQSSLTIAVGGAEVGASTENLWIGPGIRNALVMSSQAEGVPHLFLRTGRPIRTALGGIEGRWIVGRLSESDHFDADSTNDFRALSAFALTLRPAIDPGLTLGVARAVYASLEDGRVPPGAFLDVLRNVGRPNSVRSAQGPTTHRDQVFSLFARWVFPASGFEGYAEWARFEQPASLRDLLVSPSHSQGYTLGVQVVQPVVATLQGRLQAELTYLEPSASFKQRPFVSPYTSQAVEQGYTHRGQVLGASIGPGSSSQWLALDVLGARWQAGGFLGRIRWDEAAMVTAVDPPDILRHDVSLLLGLRGSVRLLGVEAFGELTDEGRLNYLFQNPILGLDNPEGVDLRNRSLRFGLRAGGSR